MTVAAGRGPAEAGPPAVTAAIDIGSNSVLLLAVRVDGGRARVVDEAVETTRLGTNLVAGGRLDPAACARTTEAVVRFAARACDAGAERTWAFATGAVRDAADGRTFARQVEAAAGVPVVVLSGEEEARLGYAAAAHTFAGPEPILAIDLGGRTTELTIGTRGELARTTSITLGVVALTETLRHDPPDAADLARLAASVDAALGASEIPAEARRTGARPIVSGGSATALASLDLGLASYAPHRVHGHRLSPGTLDRLVSRLAGMSARARGELPGLEPGRGAVLLAGAVVLGRLAAALGDALTVSAHGVRHGFLRARLAAAGVPADFRELWA